MTRDRVVEAWRQAYSEAAEAPSWLEAHRWKYDSHVAASTVLDARQKLELRPQDRVLEVGAGCGAFLIRVLHDGQRGVALDICESLVQAAGRLGVDGDQVKMVVADGVRLPIQTESFDKVLCYSVAHHFPDGDYARHVVYELIRVCRVGGVVLLGDVCGVMERHRKALIRRGIPPMLADGVLATMSPLRYLRWMPKRRNQALWSHTYRRGFFGRMLRRLPCDYEILEQNIPDRIESRDRFDVRIRKQGKLREFLESWSFVLVSASHELHSMILASWNPLYG